MLANAAFSAGMVAVRGADRCRRRHARPPRVVPVLRVRARSTTLVYVALPRSTRASSRSSIVSSRWASGSRSGAGRSRRGSSTRSTSTGYAGALDAVFARGQQITGAAMLIGTVGGGLLGQIDLSLPYLVRSGLLVAVFAIAYAVMHDIGFTPRRVTVTELPAEVARNAREGVAYGWRPAPAPAADARVVLPARVLTWAFYASQPYLLDLLSSDAVWIAGLVTAGIALSTIAGNQLVDVLSRRCGRRTTLLLGPLPSRRAPRSCSASSPRSGLRSPALLLITAATGVTSPVRQAYLHQVVPERAAGDRRLVRLDDLEHRRDRRPDRARSPWRERARSAQRSSWEGSSPGARCRCSRASVRSAGRRTASWAPGRGREPCAASGLPDIVAVETGIGRPSACAS